MTIRWAGAALLAAVALAATGAARADLVDPATGSDAAGSTGSLVVGEEIADSPAAFA